VRERAVDPHKRTRLESPEAERTQVDALMNLRIAGEDDLEAPIEPKAVDNVAAHAPADAVGRFEHEDIEAGACEIPGTHEGGETRADDDDIVAHAPAGLPGGCYPFTSRVAAATPPDAGLAA
jgi:hypothetical protein